MNRFVLLFLMLGFIACNPSSEKTSVHPELSDRVIPEGYKRFIPFNNGYEIYFPKDWSLVEKAKHENVNIVGPKPQSTFQFQPSINVTMRRGKARFKENGESTYLPFELEPYCDDYFKAVEARMSNFKLISRNEEIINQSKAQSFRFTYSDESDAVIYKHLVLVALPYRMYTVSMACLNDELFRNKDHFEVVKASFLGKAREDGSF